MPFVALGPGDGPNHARAFATRPDVRASWMELNGAIKSHMDLRRYELITVAAAAALTSSYCALVHGEILCQFLDAETVAAVARDHRDAGLDATEVAMLDLAVKVVRDATGVTIDDLQPLRDAGFDDGEVLDVVLTAAARCFFSKTLDALGVQPDARLHEMDAPLREALTVGRPIASA